MKTRPDLSYMFSNSNITGVLPNNKCGRHLSTKLHLWKNSNRKVNEVKQNGSLIVRLRNWQNFVVFMDIVTDIQ